MLASTLPRLILDRDPGGLKLSSSIEEHLVLHGYDLIPRYTVSPPARQNWIRRVHQLWRECCTFYVLERARLRLFRGRSYWPCWIWHYDRYSRRDLANTNPAID